MVTVYGTPDCIKCERTKTNLDRANVAFEYKDISTDSLAYARVKELGYQGLPVIEANGTHWSGYDRDKLNSLK